MAMRLLCLLQSVASRPNNNFPVEHFVSHIPIILLDKLHTEAITFYSSSVSTVSDYGLDGQGSIPDRDRGFFL
jgi:hypothetical protein